MDYPVTEMVYPVLDPVAIGARIKHLREAHHLSVAALAEILRLESVQAVYKWQRGESVPSVENLLVLKAIFHTDVDEILTGEKEEDESPLLPFSEDRKISFICSPIDDKISA